MKDYEITIKVRNNFLLSAIRKAGYKTPLAFAHACGINKDLLYAFICLRRPPLKVDPNGKDRWLSCVGKMADALGTTPESLFPSQHIRKCLEKNWMSFETSAEELSAFIENHRALSPDRILERKEMETQIESALRTLLPRDASIIRDLFGFDGPALQYKDCAKKYGVSCDRIHVIKHRALGKLRRPRLAKTLRPLLLSSDGPFTPLQESEG